jgi:hypothetical protein
MSAPDPTDNPEATDVHVAAPGRLESARRPGGIVGAVLRRIPALDRMRGGWERVARTMFRRAGGQPAGKRTGRDGAL